MTALQRTESDGDTTGPTMNTSVSMNGTPDRSSTSLVTGCAGFLGSHLCEALIARGHGVVGVDCFSDYYPRALKEANIAGLRGRAAFRLHEADLGEADLGELLQGVDNIFHLAGQP